VAQKVRLLLNRGGDVKLEAVPVGDTASAQVSMASSAISSEDVFLYHKTTNRAVYERALSSRPDNDEVLLWNERGELTEATTANIVVQMDGEMWTPPVSSGLLAGTYRQQLLDDGIIQERVIRISDLERCQAVYLINSVRGWRSASLTARALQSTARQ
jgi:para-aminobenzoate synthetase/4-amino-4-deoxychorismate lyase